MTSSSLPRQILFLVLAAFITVQAILWVSLFSVREAMNADASDESHRLMGNQLKTLQQQVSVIASDYHNWTDIFLNAQALDYDRLASNYGITAERGDIFQYAELHGGPFPKPVSWREGRGLEPQDGFIDDLTTAALRELVRHLDIGKRQTVDYFEFRDGHLVMFSSSYLLPEDGDLLDEINPDTLAIALIGKILSEERLATIGAEFSMTGLTVLDEPQRIDAVSLPVMGIFGEPVAWLEWYPPTPGTVLFWKMVPIMALISAMFAAFFYCGARMLRSRASKLIAQEAASFEQARTDALTALPNRLAFQERLVAIAANGAHNCAIVAVDLNGFKRINDNVGHAGGDLFLKTFGARLRTLSDNGAFVARLGGDEFVLVISSTGPLEETLVQKCAGLEEIARDQIECDGVRFDVMAAKGAAMLRAHEFGGDELLRRADRALYAAKARGTQKVLHYDNRMECEDRERLAIESRLRRALIDGDGLFMLYQPIVTAGGIHGVTRYEALARWNARDLGEIPPDKFIYVAETSGLIVRLGWLLLDMICNDIKGMKNCKIGINVSPVQLMTPGFADLFAARVKANGISSEQIEVEVTERIVIHDDVTASQELVTLRAHGFTLALDDFGTGYASIGYLTRMPFDVVKIDRSFAKFQTDDIQFQRMVRSMVGLAHAMDLRIIAEGIETPEEASCFRALGADFLQGYHYGRPTHLANFSKLGSEFVLAS